MALLESMNLQKGALRTLMRWLGVAPKPVSRAPRLEQVDFSLSGPPLDFFEFRSEDVRFSPSGRLVAVVTTQRKILLFEVETEMRPVRVEFLTAFTSPDLNSPHGVDWIDEDTLVVANRGGPGFSFFRIPRSNRWEPETEIVAITTVPSKWFGASGETRKLRTRTIITGPGSVRIRDGHLYAGCNKANTITRHRITDGPSCDEGELVAQAGIEIPDSAVISPDGVWLAVGDHDHQRVLIFRLGQTTACGELRDARMAYPHGLAFDPNGKMLVVADAGGRGLFVFHAPDGAWDRARSEATSRTEGVSELVFERVQAETAEMARALEGGTKGVDLSRDGRLLVTTCRGQTLRFFALHD